MSPANYARLICAFLVGVALSTPNAAQVRRTSAMETLRVAFDTTQKATYVAVQNHRAPVRDPQTIQVKVEQGDESNLRHTVLQPLASQGIVMVDDGREWRQLFPDAKRIDIGPSPRANRTSAAASMALAARNYSFEFGGSGEVAGRRTIQVVAKPNSKLMPVRTYWIDAETDVLLRTDLLFSNKQSLRFLDTVSITYPKSISSSRFRLETPTGYAVRQIPMPVPVKTSAEAQSLVRFTPLMRPRPTLGFETMAIEAVGDEPSRLIAYRLSDGLVRVTIYANLTDRVGKSGPFQSVSLARGNITYAVVGDLMDDALTDLLQKFLASATAQSAPPAELQRISNTLKVNTNPPKGDTDDGRFSGANALDQGTNLQHPSRTVSANRKDRTAYRS